MLPAGSLLTSKSWVAILAWTKQLQFMTQDQSLSWGDSCSSRSCCLQIMLETGGACQERSLASLRGEHNTNMSTNENKIFKNPPFLLWGVFLPNRTVDEFNNKITLNNGIQCILYFIAVWLKDKSGYNYFFLSPGEAQGKILFPFPPFPRYTTTNITMHIKRSTTLTSEWCINTFMSWRPQPMGERDVRHIVTSRC